MRFKFRYIIIITLTIIIIINSIIVNLIIIVIIISPLPKFEVKGTTFSWCFGFSNLVYSFLPFFSTSRAKLCS